MNKADKYMYEAIDNILDNGYLDENPRPKYADGTPAHTYSVNHVVRKYDLSKGEFPITSLRPIAWKTGIKELLAIYQNQSNKISEFERCGCNWWKDWALEDETIGRAYPYNLESHRPNEMKRTVVKVNRRIISEEHGEMSELPSFEMLPSIDNKVYFDRYIVIGKDNKKAEQMNDKKHSYCKIQFLSNGYITTIRTDDVGKYKGTLLNPYERTVYDVGYLGDYKSVANFEEWEVQILKTKWTSMMKRCYNETYREKSPTYKNIFVHNEWHSFENFLRDVRYLPQYFLAKEDRFENWQLDKDYYGSNAYSKDTCVFLKSRENIIYARNNGCYKITDENDNVFYDLTIAGFAETIGEDDYRKIHKALQNNNKYNNFTIEKKDETSEYVYRYELSRNQVVELIKDIQNNPYGRRHIISFWHWANIDKKALVECAYETIWNVRNNKVTGKEYLDMCLIQRSGDMLTASGAGCINEVQYAALLMMIARHTGYEAGVFTHFVANEQIYDRHVDQAIEIGNRYRNGIGKVLMDYFKGDEEAYYSLCAEYSKFPNLILNPDKTNFFEMTIDDFEMINYNPIKPQISLPLGI